MGRHRKGRASPHPMRAHAEGRLGTRSRPRGLQDLGRQQGARRRGGGMAACSHLTKETVPTPAV
eukprot:6609211-Pyramimonas_sp.AAC.1